MGLMGGMGMVGMECHTKDEVGGDRRTQASLHGTKPLQYHCNIQNKREMAFIKEKVALLGLRQCRNIRNKKMALKKNALQKKNSLK